MKNQPSDNQQQQVQNSPFQKDIKVETLPGGALNIHASNPSSSMKTEAEMTVKADQMDMLDHNESDDENPINVEPEDLHSSKKIILQRQFYEAIV